MTQYYGHAEMRETDDVVALIARLRIQRNELRRYLIALLLATGPQVVDIGYLVRATTRERDLELVVDEYAQPGQVKLAARYQGGTDDGGR